jgi:class 3 adenylate cyclase/nitrite reductase/ring-hydroxylating ferredoxin subunit/CDGSH-type Zn-finger protein
MTTDTPFPIELEQGSDYFWCSCGKSKNQPFCDGSHIGSEFSPKKFTAVKTETAYLCGCKNTLNRPFCDGSHNNVKLPVEEKIFSALVQPDNREINITEEESILIASLRNNISHLSACGGTGKCSTCRIEILDGLENCLPRGELEERLAQKLSFPSNIRLGCQTKLTGNISFRRLLLDKRDADLNNQITEQKLESVGTIRNLTILFCDIKGFTSFSESLSAYDVIFILNRYFSIMREVIIRHGGEVNNYIGDAVMAIFGLKESRQQSLRAVSASVEMLKEMDQFKSYLKKAYGRDFDIRVGVHYGEVISGSVGSGDDRKLTVIGDAVNIASRIEAINKEAGTRLLISETVYDQVKDKISVRNYLRLKLRGTSNLITLHEVSDINMGALDLNVTEVERTIEGKVWFRTLPIVELNLGEKKKYILNEKEILLINEGEVYAIENLCPHMDLPLDIGQITDKATILCPYHKSEFCFKSGEVKKWVGKRPDEHEGECKPLNTISVQKHEDYIWVQMLNT